ncbi:MAG: response regulator [Bacteroidetes bacterium 4572_128]|nr:MAG: response regulator [Bacteroidetes bacterium 4572_128]
MKAKKLLVIDDERSIRKIRALELIKKFKYNVILCDIKMPKMDGIEVLEEIFKLYTDIPVLMISGHGDIETAVEAMKKGAFDFMEKPIDLNRLLININNAVSKFDFVKENKKKIKKVKINNLNEIIGESNAINRVKRIIEKVASTEARVLITGDNGTGKELVAKALHEKSYRLKKPFIEVNCAAIPSELIESELFGHEKGAFTSAHKQRKGKFEQANGGTIFLDEIGDMSLSAQAKVLRALQEHKISRVGSDKEININVRVIAATNKDLKKEINDNKFREDLYHRLSVILIHVPKLNERIEDISLLAKHFINQICQEYGTPIRKISENAIKELQKINWTGNIRELRNVIERLLILCDNEITKENVISFAEPIGNY